MKKLFFAFAMLLASVTAGAITVTEAYQKLAAIPGAAISEMPSYEGLADNFDEGKIVMLLGQAPEAALSVKDEITDAKVSEVEIQGQHSYVIVQPTDQEEKAAALIITVTPAGPVCVYAVGAADKMGTLQNLF